MQVREKRSWFTAGTWKEPGVRATAQPREGGQVSHGAGGTEGHQENVKTLWEQLIQWDCRLCYSTVIYPKVLAYTQPSTCSSQSP